MLVKGAAGNNWNTFHNFGILSRIRTHKRHSYHGLTGKLWGVFCELFGERLPRNIEVSLIRVDRCLLWQRISDWINHWPLIQVMQLAYRMVYSLNISWYIFNQCGIITNASPLSTKPANARHPGWKIYDVDPDKINWPVLTQCLRNCTGQLVRYTFITHFNGYIMVARSDKMADISCTPQSQVKARMFKFMTTIIHMVCSLLIISVIYLQIQWPKCNPRNKTHCENTFC